MLAVESKPSAAGFTQSRPLPLESGEFIHSHEFLRRYQRMPQLKKAELIEGIVYRGSPVSVHHGKPDAIIQAWLVTYASRHPETEVCANTTVILDAENTVQPDALLRRLPEHGGGTRVNEDGYLAGPPELIVEIASSSASIDLRDKRRAYCRNRVREYLVWIVADARLEWFCLEDDDYRPQLPDAQGLFHSRVFPGLRLPVAPLLAGDTAKVLEALIAMGLQGRGTGPNLTSLAKPRRAQRSRGEGTTEYAEHTDGNDFSDFMASSGCRRSAEQSSRLFHQHNPEEPAKPRRLLMNDPQR